jgi:phage shock protein A
MTPTTGWRAGADVYIEDLTAGELEGYRLEGTTHYPAGMKLVVSYGYFPLETLTDEPLFCAVLQGVQQLQLRKDSEKQHIQQLEQNAAAQQQMVAALQQEIAQLHQKNAALQARSNAYETSLESVFSSKSWKLTAPIRSLMRLFHRGN